MPECWCPLDHLLDLGQLGDVLGLHGVDEPEGLGLLLLLRDVWDEVSGQWPCTPWLRDKWRSILPFTPQGKILVLTLAPGAQITGINDPGYVVDMVNPSVASIFQLIRYLILGGDMVREHLATLCQVLLGLQYPVLEEWGQYIGSGLNTADGALRVTSNGDP